MATTKMSGKEAAADKTFAPIIEALQSIQHEGQNLKVDNASSKPGKLWCRGTVTIPGATKKDEPTIKRFYFDICD